MLPWIVLDTLPILMLGVAFWFYRSEHVGLVRWRRTLFAGGLAANVISASVLVSFVIKAWAIQSNKQPADLDRMFPVLSMFGLALLATVLAFSGRSVSRLMHMGNGILSAILWYIAGLAASP
jgi:uncharacterized membrane protein